MILTEAWPLYVAFFILLAILIAIFFFVAMTVSRKEHVTCNQTVTRITEDPDQAFKGYINTGKETIEGAFYIYRVGTDTVYLLVAGSQGLYTHVDNGKTLVLTRTNKGVWIASDEFYSSNDINVVMSASGQSVQIQTSNNLPLFADLNVRLQCATAV